MATQKVIDALAFAVSASEPNNKDVLWIDSDLDTGDFFKKIKVYNRDTNSWDQLSPTAQQMLNELKTVDGAGSGLDADTLQGYKPSDFLGASGGSLPTANSGEMYFGQIGGVALAKSVTGDVTAAPTGAILVNNSSITNAKLYDAPANTLKGNNTGGATAPTDLTVAQVKTLLNYDSDEITEGSTNLYNQTHTGDVTGSVALTIANDAVSNAKLANMGANTIKGNNTGGAADPIDLTATQATAMLDAMVGDSGAGGTKGLVPAPGAGDAAANKFLKADGTWTALSTDNFSTADLTLTGNRTHDLSGNTLTLDNGQTIIQGAGTTSATKSLLVENSAGTDHLTVFDDGTMAFGKSTASFSIDAEYSHAGGTTFSLKNSSSATNASGGISIKNSSDDTFTLQAAAVTRSSKTFKQRAANIEGNSTISRMIFTVPNTNISNPFRFLAGGDEEHDCIFNLDKDTGQIVKLDIGSENSTNNYYAQSRIKSQLTTTTAGSEDSKMEFQTSDGGALVTNLTLKENKVGLYTATPVVRATTGGSAATFVSNTSGILGDTATWGGYTMGQVVQALQNIGILT